MTEAAHTGIGVGSLVADTYQVTRLIGRGGMGVVFEANHARLPGKRVAIKLLHGEVAADSEALLRFRREAEIASRLGHPNIVEVHDFNVLPGGQPYLVLELLIGESLDERMRAGPLGLEATLAIVRQVAAALAAAHREGVVHRDMKPQNVFLVAAHGDAGGGDVAKVLDFGISKIQGSQSIKTQDAAILGTPQYMAPEQALGRQSEVGPQTDVFALGVMVYEMLAGAPPFVGQTVPEVVFKVVYEPAPPLRDLVPGLPAHIGEAIDRALKKKPDERFQTMSDFMLALTGSKLATWRTPPVGVPSTRAVTTDPLGATVDSANPVLAALPAAPSVPTPAPTPAPAPAPASAPAPAPAARSRRFPLLAVVTLVALAIAAAAATLYAIRRAAPSDDDRPATARRPPPATPVTGVVPVPAPAPADAAPPAAPPADAAPHAPIADAAPAPATKPPTPPPKKPPKPIEPPDEDEPPGGGDGDDDGDRDPASRPDLAAGQHALQRGDFAEAKRLADRVLRRRPGAPAAHALRAMAACGLQDLGDARASLRNVPRRLKRKVRTFCARTGVPL